MGAFLSFAFTLKVTVSVIALSGLFVNSDVVAALPSAFLVYGYSVSQY